MRVLVVLEENEAMSLVKSREFYIDELKDEYNPVFMNNIKNYLEYNTGYNNNPIIGLGCVDGSACDLRKHFDYVPNYLGTSAGDYILEIEVPDDEIVFMLYDDFIELEGEGELVTEDDELYQEDIIDKLSLRLPTTEYDTYICFIPKIRISQCRCFLVISDDWSSEEKHLGGIPMVKVNKLHAFG